MVEMDILAAERLELLSNTAMLKKVLDRKDTVGGSRGSRSDLGAFSRYEHPKTPVSIAPSVSPRYLVSNQSQRCETPSPHVVAEASRDSPPDSYREESNNRIHRHQQEYHPHHSSFRNPEGSQYPPFPPLASHSGYMHGAPPMDRSFPEHRAPGNLAPIAPHPSSRAQSTYPVKENVAPHPFRSPYEDRRSISAGSHHHHAADPSGRPSNFYSPAPSVSEDGEDNVAASNRLSYQALVRENYHMRDQLLDKDAVISSLQQRVNQLETQISELRQLPTGKISHIPIDDMIRIMQEYGSEVSNQTLPKRRDNIKKASIVRQFRRWNPEFFRYFIHVNGEWVPKLGKEGELQRRVERRRELKRQAAATKSDDSR